MGTGHAKSCTYIEDKTYNHPKLDSLRSVFQYLNEKHCIIRDELFLYRLNLFTYDFVFIYYVCVYTTEQK